MNVQELHKQLTKLIEEGHGDAVVCTYLGEFGSFEVDYTGINSQGLYTPKGYSGEVRGKIFEFY